jgi:hypothetical protein
MIRSAIKAETLVHLPRRKTYAIRKDGGVAINDVNATAFPWPPTYDASRLGCAIGLSDGRDRRDHRQRERSQKWEKVSKFHNGFFQLESISSAKP